MGTQLKLTPQQIETIKKEIILQSGETDEERWSEKDLEEEIATIRKQLQQLTGTKNVNDTTVLMRLVDEYDAFDIEELKVKEVMGERVKYTDIKLEDFPDEDHGGKPFEDLLRGVCLAGCVTSIFETTYTPQGMTEKKPKFNVRIQDDTGEFTVRVYGKNPRVIGKWSDIAPGDYVEFSIVKITERQEKNEDYDKEMEEDAEDNPRFVGTGQPEFRFLFGSDNIESLVQKIPREKYPELPSLQELFGVKTVSVFQSEGGGRYITEGVLVSVDSDTEGKKGRTVKGWFYLTIGVDSLRVTGIFQRTATKNLPKSKDELRAIRFQVLGWYNPENNVYRIERVLNQTRMLDLGGKKRVTKKITKPTKTKKAPVAESEEPSLDDAIAEALQDLIEQGTEEFILQDFMKMLEPADAFIPIDVLKVLKEHSDVELVGDDDVLTPTFRFKPSDAPAEAEEEDSSETDEELDTELEEAAIEILAPTPEQIRAQLLEQVKSIAVPSALKQFTAMSNAWLKHKDLIEKVFDELVAEGKLVLTEGNEKVELGAPPAPALEGVALEIAAAIKANEKGLSLKQLEQQFDDYNVKKLMGKHFAETVPFENGEICKTHPNRWRFIKTS